MTIRKATKADYPRILAIYNHYIENSTATMEWDTLSLDAFSERLCRITEKYPLLVYEEDGVIWGYAYLDAFHERKGYHTSCDLSIYCDKDARGRGIGRRLTNAILAMARDMGMTHVISIITTENEDSLRFHERMGFVEEGRLNNVCEKFSRRIGTVYMVKEL